MQQMETAEAAHSASPAVGYELKGNIAVITVDSPPVNALSTDVRNGLDQAIRRADADAAAKSVVITGRGKVFIAGADIKMLGKPRTGALVPAVLAFVEQMKKPVVAAIQGTALGGGLEVALGCHARVAHASAKVGLPEVNLGLIPGAGGTQRLPRLIGAVDALDIISSGKPVNAARALALGIVDAVTDADVVAVAIAKAQELIGSGVLPRCRDGKDVGRAGGRDEFERRAAAILVKEPASDAQKALIAAIRATFELGFNEGMAQEGMLFSQLLEGDSAKAQIHAFIAERASAHVSGVSKQTPRLPIRRVAVLGAGTMGGGIAITFANAGFDVTLIETKQEALDAARARIHKIYDGSVARGRMIAEVAEATKARMDWVVGIADGVADADLVIEAVYEDMGLKKEIFRALEKHAKPTAILASNTSYQNIDEMAAETSRPGNVIGMHYFSPANVMPLLEVVRGKDTSPEVLATVLDAARKTGKVPVVVGVCYGFVGNRMLWLRTVETQAMLLEGNSPADIDKVLTEFGFKMGPFAMADLAGVDVAWRLRQAKGERLEPADSVAEAGRWGQKTGKGYYAYPDGAREGVEDPEAARLIADVAARLGVPQRPATRDEMLARMLYPMINEGSRILEEGVVERASDIDVVYIHGYNWPKYRGGPMWYADHVGLPVIVAELDRLADMTGRAELKPSALLRRYAESGKPILSFGED